MNGIIETATGDLLRAGFTTFVAAEGETVRSDVPFPSKIRKPGAPGEFHRSHGSNGTAWILIDQPIDPDAVEKEEFIVLIKAGTATIADLMGYLILRDGL